MRLNLSRILGRKDTGVPVYLAGSEPIAPPGRDTGSESDTFSPPDGTSDQVPRYQPVRRDFFDLHPEEVPAWRQAGGVPSARRELNLKPALAVAGVACAIAVIVAVAILLWPSSTTRVPDVVGKTLAQAIESARGSGLKPRVDSWSYSDVHSDGVILAQSPPSGRQSSKGGTLEFTVSKGPQQWTQGATSDSQGSPVSEATSPGSESGLASRTVCIDPSGQVLSSGSTGDWTDPSLTKREYPAVVVYGVATGNPDHLLNLDIATRLKGLLEKDGIKVVMTRDSGDVNLTGTARADIAANSQADLLVSVHTGHSSTDPGAKGTSVFYPVRNSWTDAIYEKSKTAALFVGPELVKACGTQDRGVTATGDLALLNWSKVPAIEVEVAFLSNAGEDALLGRPDFRDKAAWGLRNGIIKYFQNP